MSQFLTTPDRPEKPRNGGMTCLIDNGTPTQFFTDVMDSHGGYVDFVKFGWCTALVTKDIEMKIDKLREQNIEFYFGGTLFEKSLLQGKLNQFHDFVKSFDCKYVEVSNGTIDISNREKSRYIKEFSKEFRVLSEVGYKDSGRSDDMNSDQWVEYIQEDLEAGSYKVITESRESGKSGICGADGKPKSDLISEILDSNIPIEKLIFEAPNKELQTFFIKRVGCNVNLGNVALQDVVGLETLRQGLRSDTLELFEMVYEKAS